MKHIRKGVHGRTNESDAELQKIMTINAPLDKWMGNHLYEKNQIISTEPPPKKVTI